jgi:photosystem II stability/assembly factor-like uncharacterized protein
MKKLVIVSAIVVVADLALSMLRPVSAETLADLAQRTHYHGIAFSRAGSAVLLLATHHGLFAVDDKGAASLVSPVQDFMGFSPDPADNIGYYASGHPPTGGNSGFLRSSDGGATWKQLSPGAAGPVDFHQMSVSSANPKTIYGQYRQMQVSRDGGVTWAVAGQSDAPPIAIAASAEKTDRVYAATEDGIHVSEDAGVTWTRGNFVGEIVSTITVGQDKTIYAFVVGHGLVKSNENTPDKWQTISNSFGEAIPLHLAIDPKDSTHLALTTQSNDVLESRDGGASWYRFGER